MAITKDNMVDELNARLNRSETTTTLAQEIRGALRYISGFAKWKALYVVSGGSDTIASGTNSIAYPTGLRVLDKIVFNDGTYDGKPLTEMDWNQWLKNRHDESSTNYDEPKRYVERGSNIYLDPVPDDNDGVTDWAYTLYYWQWHPDQATILFGDEFEEALYELLMWKYLTAQGPEMEDAANYHLKLGIAELNRLKPTADEIIYMSKGDLP